MIIGVFGGEIVQSEVHLPQVRWLFFSSFSSARCANSQDNNENGNKDENSTTHNDNDDDPIGQHI